MYAWLITRDHSAVASASLHNARGIIGPLHTRLPAIIRQHINDGTVYKFFRNHPTRRQFRMRDEKGDLMYTGWLITFDRDSLTGFEPLDDFGAPNAGAATIEYHNGTEWTPLS